MELSEAIKHCEEKAKDLRQQSDFIQDQEEFDDCCECAREHEQLAAWLTELQERREVMEYIKKHYVLVGKSPKDRPNELIIRKAFGGSEAEKEIEVTEEEHSCVTCKFGNLYSDSEPCCNCTEDNDMFKPIGSEDK